MIIIDYNVGNIGSVVNMFKKIGVHAKLSGDRGEILAADKLLLPGVGAFDHGMTHLRNSGLIDILERKVFEDKTPLLGICLGMQLLMDGSEEGHEKGLGWIKGTCRKFDEKITRENLKIPHMGWNLARAANYDGLFKGLEDEARFYFVHSYHAVCDAPETGYATTHHGYDFTSAIHRDNIYGVQFHPEKSHKFGMRLLRNFAELS